MTLTHDVQRGALGVEFRVEGCAGVSIVGDSDGRALGGVEPGYSETPGEAAAGVDHQRDLGPPQTRDVSLGRLLLGRLPLTFRQLS